jgi:histidinol-phosphate/aromatic aminotransferase/cobyric acid decarboxylase-like protein
MRNRALALGFALDAALGDPARFPALRHAGYPDERVAREAVAARHGRPAAEVLLTNGACDAFWLVAHGLRPRRAACVHPGFTEPEAARLGADHLRVAVRREAHNRLLVEAFAAG